MDTLGLMEIEWLGPFLWPNKGSPFPNWPGVYLWTFPYHSGYIIYAAGISRRPLSKRFHEHTRCYLEGTYTLFDISDLMQGLRTERWHGFWFFKNCPPEKATKFEQCKIELQSLAREQMAACRIFAAQVPTTPRLLERLEAAIMLQLYNAPKPFCDIPDRGMMLAPRWQSEAPITVLSRTTSVLHGIPELLEI